MAPSEAGGAVVTVVGNDHDVDSVMWIVGLFEAVESRCQDRLFVMRGNDDREIASLGRSYGFPTSPWQQGDDRPEPLVDHQHADEQQDGGTHQAEDSSHLMSPSSNTETDVVKPVMIRLTLPRTGVPTPRRAELEHVEWMAIRHVVVTALQDAVQPPLVR